MTAGCPEAVQRIPLDPIPMPAAIRVVNDNVSKITGTLRASGSVDATLRTTSGSKRSFHLDAILFYLGPTYLRFDLKKFGDRQILLGSNEQQHWYYSREDDAYTCSRHAAAEDQVTELPIRPDQIIDALGLSTIPSSSAPGVLFQRVEGDFQQILFVQRDEDGVPILEKEYWLDRYAPRLVRRVVFRDSDGVMEMESRLGAYRKPAAGGPWLPHEIRADWPGAGAQMCLRVARWKLVEQVKPDGIQFATPRECEAH
ncbi:MAG: hypothetical protein JSU63_00345 [Phycisphaerales bacterium]|nr:MAG: hypothetical protein JSU63_00345 [Phycisphaerales bacterium]